MNLSSPHSRRFHCRWPTSCQNRLVFSRYWFLDRFYSFVLEGHVYSSRSSRASTWAKGVISIGSAHFLTERRLFRSMDWIFFKLFSRFIRSLHFRHFFIKGGQIHSIMCIFFVELVFFVLLTIHFNDLKIDVLLNWFCLQKNRYFRLICFICAWFFLFILLFTYLSLIIWCVLFSFWRICPYFSLIVGTGRNGRW